MNDKTVKTTSKQAWIVFIIYVVMFVLMFAISTYLAVTADLPVLVDKLLQDSVTDITFYDSNDKPVENTMDLCVLDLNSDYESSIYTIIPDDLSESMSLCFRTKHMYLTAYIDNTKVYESVYVDNALYTDSLGVEWVEIPLELAHGGKELRIDYRLAYNEHNCGFDNISYCRADGFILSVISNKLAPLFICTIYVVIGIIFIIMGMITSKMLKNDFSLFWLGALALSVAAYCLFETQILQVFLMNRRLLHLCVMFAMVMIPIPAVAYGNSFLKFKSQNILPLFAILDCISFLVMTTMNALNIVDYHSCMLVLLMLIVLAMLILGYGIVRYIFHYIKNQRKMTIYVVAMITGLVSIIVTGFIDLLRYWHPDNEDPAAFIRVGFLGFLICFSIASSERVIYAFQTSAHAKLIAKLAYEDGLTGLKNRTSYQEKSAAIEANRTPTGVVMMDLNNLKQVNDTLGHDDGDSMIINAADIIRKSFDGSYIDCYRIGGDEFVALVQDSNDDIECIGRQCRDCINTLRKAYKTFNMTHNETFDIIIAVGYNLYDPDSSVSLKDVVDGADSLMYDDKRHLKSASNHFGMSGDDAV